MSHSNANQTVAKNTLVLYIRMFITMAIGMWTSRIVINALGFVDQGLYNAVAGFVGFCSFITFSIGGAFARFINYEMGRNDIAAVNKVVQNALVILITLAVIILIAAETAGLWFLNHKMVIPADRLFAVNVIYQFAVGMVIISLLSCIPNVIITAYERMDIYAFVSILTSATAFSIGLAIKYYGGDKLILFGTLHFIVSLSIYVGYMLFIHNKFKQIRLRFTFDGKLFRPMFSFTGWNGLGTIASISKTSGTSVLLNLFGGPIANTINGIANSVNSIVTMFVGDFTTAFSPQITKRYAAKEYTSLVPFLHQCSKFAYCLMLIMAVPVIINAELLINLWLGKMPEGTVIFARLIIIYSLIECMGRPLLTAQIATGNIRNYHLTISTLILLALPFSYILLKIGFPLYYTYISIIITTIFAFIGRILFLNTSIPHWSARIFIVRVLSRCIVASILAFILPILIHLILPQGIFYGLLQCVIGFVWASTMAYFIALNSSERYSVRHILLSFITKITIRN